MTRAKFLSAAALGFPLEPHPLTHDLAFADVPAGYGLCRRCGRLVDAETWAREECEGRETS